MLDRNPELEKDELFSNLAVLLVGSGGLLLVIGFYFGSSIGSSNKDSTITDLASKSQDANHPQEPKIDPIPDALRGAPEE